MSYAWAGFVNDCQATARLASIRRGGGGRGCGVGTLASPASLFIWLTSRGNTTPPRATLSSPNPSSSTLAFTDHLAIYLVFRLGPWFIRRSLSSTLNC